MAYTANQLITGAYYAAGVVSRDFETISGGQAQDGLAWLNDIIAEKDVDQSMIPYESTYNFTAKVGVEKYYIPKLSQIDTLVFYLDQVRYAMVYTKRNQYFGSSRVENINTLPFEWYFERQIGGGNLYIYFKPDRNYPIEIHGSFSLDPVALNQDLTSNVTIADLGVPTLYKQVFLFGVFTSLGVGQLVVNDFDLMGQYFSIGELINYINTGIIPGVKASIVVNDFILSSTTEPPVPIYISSTGYLPNGANFIGNVAAASTTNLTSTYDNGPNAGIGATLTSTVPAVLVVDSYAVQLGDRILVRSQTNAEQNGSYSLTTLGTGSVPWVLTRTTNFDTAAKINAGSIFTALNNSLSSDHLSFIQNQDVAIVGISPINFLPFSSLTFSNFSTIANSSYQIFNAVGFDRFYITYLRYALADRICAEYNYTTPDNVMRQLSKYESWISKKSKLIDLEMQKTSTLQKRGSFNYAFINLAKGWGPS